MSGLIDYSGALGQDVVLKGRHLAPFLFCVQLHNAQSSYCRSKTTIYNLLPLQRQHRYFASLKAVTCLQF